MVFRWLHRFIRKRTKPIPGDTAFVWRQRFSLIYALVAWNAFGAVIYLCFKGRGDWADYYGLKNEQEKSVSPATAWAATLGIQNAKVVRLSGFTKTDEYDIVDGKQVEKHNSDDQEDKETL